MSEKIELNNGILYEKTVCPDSPDTIEHTYTIPYSVINR